MQNILNRLTTLENNVKNVVRFGIIKQVDKDTNLVMVDLGNNAQSPSLPYLVNSSGNASVYFIPKVGDQVTLISKNGNIHEGFVIPSISLNNKVDNEDTWKLQFAKGSIAYSDGKLEITSDEEVTIKTKKAIIDSQQIILGDDSGGEVVCKNHTCSFTGGPHTLGSTKIKGAI